MGGFEQGHSRHNEEGVHRDYQLEAERLMESAKRFGFETKIYHMTYIGLMGKFHYGKFPDQGLYRFGNDFNGYLWSVDTSLIFYF